MFGDEFKHRLSIQQISSFFLTGVEMHGEDDGTPEERHRRYSREFAKGMDSFRDNVANTDWSGLTDHEKTIKAEPLSADMQSATFDLNNLYFQMGLLSGLQLGNEIATMKEKTGF